MSNTLKVRDRTTNKVKDAVIDADVYARLKEYKYLTDKNSNEPFREMTVNGKRQRIALKRDVMGFGLGDPRRVCYIDKANLFDCRTSNLSTKQVSPLVKLVKPVKATTTATTETVVVETATANTTAEVETTTTDVNVETTSTPVATTTMLLPDNLDVKRSLVKQIGEDRLLDLVSVDDLLGAWAEANGYRKAVG